MSEMQKVWFVTGSSTGFGRGLVQQLLAGGAKVVATARRLEQISGFAEAYPETALTVALDVTDEASVEAAVRAALERFGRVDVLVNNAGYGHLGFFEEKSQDDVDAQFATNVFGLFKVTRSVLPCMRAARKGHIFNISSIAGVRGSEGGSLYCSSKFAVEGFSESLAKEVAPFGIFVTIVEPGFFRTEFLSDESARFGGGAIADYAEASARIQGFFKQRNGTQAGDPRKLAEALVTLAGEAAPPLRFAVGSDAVEVTETKLAGARAELEAWRGLSVGTDYRE